MDLRELGYFVAVFEEKSVSAAARRCFVSQPSVSEALTHLEEEVAARLFVRHRKGVAPTAAGEQLYPIARRLVDEVGALPSLFKAVAAPRTLTLGLMRSLDVARTRDLLAPLMKGGALDLRLVGDEDPCDARIVARSQRGEHEVFAPLWEERYVVVVPRAHPLAAAKGGTVRLADLGGSRLVARCHCEQASRFTARGGRGFDVVAIAATEEWALALVAAGVGIAIVPAGVVGKRDDVVVLALRDRHARRQVGIAYPSRHTPVEVQRLVDTLTARVRRTR